MKKLIQLFLAGLALAGAALAQSGGGSVVGVARQFLTLSSISGSCTAGYVGYYNGGYYSCVSGAWSPLGGVSGLTTGDIPVATGATTLGNSSVSDNGSTVQTLETVVNPGLPTPSGTAVVVGTASNGEYRYEAFAQVGTVTGPWTGGMLVNPAPAVLNNTNYIQMTITCGAGVTAIYVQRDFALGTPSTTGVLQGSPFPCTGGTAVVNDTGLTINGSIPAWVNDYSGLAEFRTMCALDPGQTFGFAVCFQLANGEMNVFQASGLGSGLATFKAATLAAAGPNTIDIRASTSGSPITLAATGDTNLDIDLVPAGTGSIGVPSLKATTIYSVAGTALPTCNAAALGERRVVSDATSATPGTTYAGSSYYTIGVECIYNSNTTTYTWIID